MKCFACACAEQAEKKASALTADEAVGAWPSNPHLGL